MITIDETIRFIENEYAWILVREPANAEECKIYEAVMTVLSTLEYSKLLTDKFGSLEEALEAEKVVHCKDCGIWKPDETYETSSELLGICNKPGSDARYRCATEYCCDGLYYKIADKFLKED